MPFRFQVGFLFLNQANKALQSHYQKRVGHAAKSLGPGISPALKLSPTTCSVQPWASDNLSQSQFPWL